MGKGYYRCPECKSVDLQEILVDDSNGIVHLRCRTCRHQFWKNLPKGD
jgi:transcription elongation factor Elf1